MASNEAVSRGPIGSLSVYEMGNDWATYQETLDLYFVAKNIIEDDRKVAILLLYVDEQVRERLKELCDPALPKNTTYMKLCELLLSRFPKKISVFKNRIEFYDLKQTESESIKEWYTNIEKKALQCKFGNIREEVLKDKFVSALKKGPVLDRVCEEEHTKELQDLYKCALEKEAAMLAYSSPINTLALQNQLTGQAQVELQQNSNTVTGTQSKEHPSSSSNNCQGNNQNGNSGQIMCCCNKTAALLTVKKDNENKGRMFYNCQQINRCKFFIWADQIDNADGNGGNGNWNGRGGGNPNRSFQLRPYRRRPYSRYARGGIAGASGVQTDITVRVFSQK